MGGKLLVESVPDSGSTFKFEIIFDTIDTAAGKEEDGADHEKHKIPESPNFNGLILVCDDNTFNQQLICLHLERLGLKTIVAENGKLGVEIVRERKEKNEKPFDLIFMDMFMPVMDGIEASDKIMAMNTETPIVAMTANVMVSELEIYKEHGISDCLGKPFSSHDLRQILLKYLSPINSKGTN
jgi:CheY-like chemotaxis protein